jgi:hypothetical protein
MTQMTGQKALMELLLQAGVEYVFGIPGATEILFMDALERVPRINYILGLNEIVCAGMAEGYARASGKPGFLNLHTALSPAVDPFLPAFSQLPPLLLPGWLWQDAPPSFLGGKYATLFITREDGVYLRLPLRSPSQITSSYSSPLKYKKYECSQMAIELNSLAKRENQVVIAQEQRIKSGNVQAFWLGYGQGDGIKASELANVRGEKESKRSGVTLGQRIHPKVLNRWFRRGAAALNLDVTLYAGTKHSTTTELGRHIHRELIRKGGTGHATESAFEHYYHDGVSDQLRLQEAIDKMRLKVVKWMPVVLP